METLNKNCKLCGNIIKDEHFRLIDEVIQDILDTLLLKTTFNEEVQHLMCSTCSEKLFAAYNFKSMCLSTNYTITPHLEGSSSVDLKEIYVKEEGSNMLDDKQICRLCMQTANDEYFSVQDLQTDIVRAYIPEINLNVTVDPIICKMCYDSLFTHSSFLKNCLNAECRTFRNDSSVMDTHMIDSYIKTEDIEIKREEEDQEMSSDTQFTEMKFEETIKQERIVVNTDFSDLPELSQPGTSVQPQPSRSKDSAAVYRASSVVFEAENYLLKKKIDDLERELKNFKSRFSYKHIKGNDSLIMLYTGLPNETAFMALYHSIEKIEINYYMKWKVERISRIDQLLMCLMKLRQNFPHGDIAHRFKISTSAVSNVVMTWIHVLHEFLLLKQSIPDRNETETCLPAFFTTFPNRRNTSDCMETATVTSMETQRATSRPTFFTTFTNHRILLNCMETATVTSMDTQKVTSSSSKQCNTWKALIGVAPDGVITFVSKVYPGSTSDKEIIQESGVLNRMKAGDVILVDKSFLVKDILPAGVHVDTPSSSTDAQVTPAQVQQTESVASARIKVEQAVRRIKSYKLLKHVPPPMFQHADAIVQIVGALTNLQLPLLREVQTDDE